MRFILRGELMKQLNFSKIGQILEMPDLLDMQKQSFDWFLQLEDKPENRKIQGLQAAFVDIGTKKMGFLQMGEILPEYWQWRDDVPPEQRNRRPRIQEVLRRGQELAGILAPVERRLMKIVED